MKGTHVKKYTLKEKFSLLMASVMILSAGAISSIIPLLADHFKRISRTNIELLVTTSSIMTILTIVFGSVVVKRLGAKKTVLFGMIILFISTVIAIMKPPYWLMLISRLLFGCGIGFINPILLQYVSHLFEGKELSRMLSLQSSFEGLGGMFFSYFVGYMSIYGWNIAFYPYFMVIPLFFLFLFNVKDIDLNQAETKKISTTFKPNKAFIKYILVLAVGVVLYMTPSLKISQFFIETGIGDIQNASMVLMLTGVGSMISGFVYKWTTGITKHNTPPIMFASMALILFTIATTQSVTVVYLCSFFNGFTFRTFVPYTYGEIFKEFGSHPIISRILLINFNISLAITPIILNFIMKIFNLSSIPSLFQIGSISLLVLTVYTYILEKKRTKFI